MKPALLSCCLVMSFVLLPAAEVSAQFNRTTVSNPRGQYQRVWYQNLTNDRTHHFGKVARASNQARLFEFVNNTGSDLYLTNVRTSCGCTKPKIMTPHVKPGETAKLNAVFDTLNFYGERGATVTLSLKKVGAYVEYGELQFSVKGNIRRDVVLSPGMFDFRDLANSEAAQKTAKVMYAGRSDWKILEVKSTNPNVQAEVREIDRKPTRGATATTYEMVVKVSDQQAAGPFNEVLTIVTNDPKTNGMPVKVSGNIKQMIDVAPVTLGVVNMGQEIKKKLIVRSPQAISIDEVRTKNGKLQFDPSEGKKTLHILTYTLDTSATDEIDDWITIVTTGDQKRETRVPFSVQIVAATTTSQPKD